MGLYRTVINDKNTKVNSFLLLFALKAKENLHSKKINSLDDLHQNLDFVFFKVSSSLPILYLAVAMTYE